MAVRIDRVDIGRKHRPYVIGEISGNHLGSLERCLKLVDIAADAGASAVKIQTIDPGEMTVDTNDPRFIVSEGPWKGYRVADVFRENMLPKEWHRTIFDHAALKGITAFSSPFDIGSIHFLEALDVPAFKVASNEIFDWPMLEAMCQTGKPIIVSTGTASEKLVRDTYNFLRRKGANELAFLHCVSAYPPKYEEMHLETMQCLRMDGDVEVGLSDHTVGNEASIAAVALGATIVEKHITLSRDEGGLDSHFSIEPKELRELVLAVGRAWQSTSKGVKYGGERDLEKDGIFTRQLWTRQDVRRGEILTWENIKSIRAPVRSKGVPTFRYEELLGKVCPESLVADEPVPIGWLDIPSTQS